MLLQVRSMTEGARNAVLTNIVVFSLALLLSCCNERETKILLGIVGPTSIRHLILTPPGIALPVNNMVSIPAPNNTMTA
jgi:hypothetical protein